MSNDKSQQLPQSLDAEQVVLGSVLKDPEALTVVSATLKPEDFYYPKHRSIMAAAVALSAKSEPCDITTVANELNRSGELDRIGGRVYLVKLMEMVASTAHIEHHVGIVREGAIRRHIILTGTEIVRSAHDEARDLDELLGSAEKNIIEIGQKVIDLPITHLGTFLPDVMAELEDWHCGGKLKGLVRTGFNNVDEMILGLERKEFVIVAGRPSQGKTQAVLQIMEHVALKQGIPCHGFSLEMTDMAMGIRTITSNAGVNFDTIKRGKTTSDEWDKLRKAAGRLQNAPVYFSDVSGLTPNELRLVVRRQKARHNIGLVVVDYIQLMSSGEKNESRVQEVSFISRELKKIAKELGIVLIGVAQMNRTIEHGGYRRPQLSDLKESGSLEQDADSVMFIDNRAKRTDGRDNGWWWNWEKVRNGVCGDAMMLFKNGRWADRSDRRE